MRQRSILLFLTTLTAIYITQGAAAFAEMLPHKKLIEVGWDIVDTGFLRDHFAEMEKSSPFDGILLWVTGKQTDGKTVSTDSIWDKTPWRRAWFQGAIDDLKSCKFIQFTDNFARVDCTPGTLNWSDDESWKALSKKMDIVSWVCKQGGLKGVCIDPESYGAQQFHYSSADGKTFAEVSKLARKRGAQVMRAIASKYPSMTLMSFWFMSLNMNANHIASPEKYLEKDAYGLWPAFVNGMLDAAPPEMSLVDGNEKGYYMEGKDYYVAANRMINLTGPAIAMVSPSNRKKYRNQMQVGFGFYLDMYINPEGNPYYRGPIPGGSRLDRLRENLTAAVDASDQYVWIYGEQCKWWPSFQWSKDEMTNLEKTTGKGRMWEEALPGLTQTLANVH